MKDLVLTITDKTTAHYMCNGYRNSLPANIMHRFFKDELIQFRIGPSHMKFVIEVRDEMGDVIEGMAYYASEILLSPNVCGRGYSIWVDGRRAIDLTPGCYRPKGRTIH